ncbi:hypothetical protein NEF87_001097 [Candidatus Lokiarchaeum ossiferum]|uniref:Uncharacterized protein n=1 Tax=Candidatus Lokiarchaeum ossiferum TaxID=2951803 RepID=A0ABY6HQY7_9ARCH|nr:hypothetical protein NEF87_001097 [Candidatus Lokiarchaeum sp. B-35]
MASREENDLPKQNIIDPNIPVAYSLISLPLIYLIGYFLFNFPPFNIFFVLLQNLTTYSVAILSKISLMPEVQIIHSFNSILTVSASDPALFYENINWLFSINKWCTAMNIGVYIIALVLVTPIFHKRQESHPLIQSLVGKKELFLKLKAISLMLLLLFILNSIRVWLFLYLFVMYDIPKEISHDLIYKPVIFSLGIFFVAMFQKLGIDIAELILSWFKSMLFIVQSGRDFILQKFQNKKPSRDEKN